MINLNYYAGVNEMIAEIKEFLEERTKETCKVRKTGDDSSMEIIFSVDGFNEDLTLRTEDDEMSIEIKDVQSGYCREDILIEDICDDLNDEEEFSEALTDYLNSFVMQHL